MCSRLIKLLTKTVRLSGRNLCASLHFVVSLSLPPMPGQETGSEAKRQQLAQQEVWSASQIFTAGVSPERASILMPDNSAPNQLANTHKKIVSPLCACVRVRVCASGAFFFCALNLPVYTPSPPHTLKRLALRWSWHVQLLNPRSSPVKLLKRDSKIFRRALFDCDNYRGETLLSGPLFLWGCQMNVTRPLR